MSSIKKIQIKLGRIQLKKERRKIHRKTIGCNFDSSISVGILYNATQRNDCDFVKNLVLYLKQSKKEVMALGYVNLKDSSAIFKPHISYAYFDNNNLNNVCIPKSIDVTNFINKPYSLLIDLNVDDDFPLEYVSTLSRATFKVGATGGYRENELDFTINIGTQKNLKYLLTQINHYLNMITP